MKMQVPTPPLSPSTLSLCKSRFFTVLAELNTRSPSDTAATTVTKDAETGKEEGNRSVTFGKQPGIRKSSGNTWVYDLNMWIQSRTGTSSLELHDECLNIRKEVLKAVKNIHKKVGRAPVSERILRGLLC